jgi:hypothetical protein
VVIIHLPVPVGVQQGTNQHLELFHYIGVVHLKVIFQLRRVPKRQPPAHVLGDEVLAVCHACRAHISWRE